MQTDQKYLHIAWEMPFVCKYDRCAMRSTSILVKHKKMFHIWKEQKVRRACATSIMFHFLLIHLFFHPSFPEYNRLYSFNHEMWTDSYICVEMLGNLSGNYVRNLKNRKESSFAIRQGRYQNPTLRENYDGSLPYRTIFQLLSFFCGLANSEN